MRPKLELDADRWERLLKLLAEEDVGRQALRARCITDDACVRPAFGAYGRQRQQAVIDLIGAKNADTLEKRMASAAASVDRMRDRGLSLAASSASAGTHVAAPAPFAKSHGHSSTDGMATGADAQANKRANIPGVGSVGRHEHGHGHA